MAINNCQFSKVLNAFVDGKRSYACISIGEAIGFN